jgi:hypothetical protein
MRTILLSLFSRHTPNGNLSPKSYPFYKELVELFNKEYITIQLGSSKEPDIGAVYRYNNLPAEDLVRIVQDMDCFCSVDSFLPHLYQCYAPEKKGVVIWSLSDPLIFGYKTNINLLKDRKYLRAEQYLDWNDVEQIKEAFVEPTVILSKVKEI